ncbi:MAG: Glycosyl transferase group 1 [Microgenomates group bacterium GW2011_GWC1_39_7b]|uniref:Glycosyl transferase group 1 n=3 Tax=Candidatus Woeseibacteriota TaxID=1752722 RepID=A0A0G0LL70_9BACT|nr:MAG: Glycosyl transferase group 1 [Candidatus Woesebacteria bacterium GW2011_GWB1_39_10]KKR26574.1 MAG: Glycosyl transferase group 1 [Microgenomates group bacterium GW2011_GWC1_39_7b]KKR74396.1 MAG: Glycosyl transferase group 1 [Candidatus Woesebacteria bacterium GW2011_GWA2_40_7]KKS90778.1 MAG: Glycosyl transferase group 1 [Candidatus Woesebacteria bacterium GW2011_GWA1_43_12]
MIIGIDGNEANIEKRVGINEYAFQILWNLQKLQEKEENPHKLIVYLKNDPRSDMPKETQNFKYKVIPSVGIWVMTKLIPNLLFDPARPDIFFSPSHYVPMFAPIPKVCSIMDLGYLEYTGQFQKKDFWQLKVWSAISILVSKSVIAISNSTKKDIVRHYPFSKEKVYVTYLGFDPKRFNPDISEKDVRRVKNRYSIVDDYVLYLGTLKPSKNIEGLIDAFSRIRNTRYGIKLVIAGKKGWLFDSIYKKVSELKLKDKIIFTDFVSDEDKPALIKGAKVFVLPSFWEGFGLDAVNAMACGVPVVASGVGSLPEVVGNGGILVNPTDAESIASGILEVINASTAKYNSMIARGLAQAKKFSWEKTARETLRILEGVR